jgi:hypothetical protein
MDVVFAYYKRKRDQADQELQDARKELRAAKRSKRGQQEMSSPHPCTTVPLTSPSRSGQKSGQMRLLLMIYSLANFRMEVAVSFAVGQGRSPRFEVLGPEEDLARRRLAFGDQISSAADGITDDQLLDMLTDPCFFGTWARVLLAVRYVMEYDLFQWLLTQNCDRGIAPGASLLVRAALKRIPAGAPACAKDHFTSRLQRMEGKARFWLQSFRARWHAEADKKLNASSNLSVQEMLNKAMANFRVVASSRRWKILQGGVKLWIA